MDLQRLFLFLIFAFSIGLILNGWQHQQNPEIALSQQAQSVAGKTTDQPIISHPTAQNISTPSVSTLNSGSLVTSGHNISVKTDLFEIEISQVGGDIARLSFTQHPDVLDRSKPLILFNRGDKTHNYSAQSGLLGSGLPNHSTLFSAEHEHYELSDKSDILQVRLTANSSANLRVTKTISFHRGSYLIDIGYELENLSNQTISTSSYYQLVRDGADLEGSSRFLPTYIGGAVYTEKDKFQKISFGDIEKSKVNYPTHSDDGWIGILQHYFVAVWLPKASIKREFFTRKLDGDSYSVGIILPEQLIQPGQKSLIGTSLYVGPTESSLDKIAPGLGLTVDYGWLTVLSAPLFWVMELLFQWTRNWGVAIILLTFLIKLLFFPLSATSYRSMAKMRIVAPKLEKIKQQCGTDRAKLNQAMMDLYKTEKINPLGGCLPIAIQIPVFIALYWAILASVELRYAPFFGWITDLSAPDPYYVLPLIMGISMIIQMRLNPKPADPMQAKVMQIMPIAFSVVFFFFPAGLVLYSIVNNILSIGQQWYITRLAEGGSKGVTTK